MDEETVEETVEPVEEIAEEPKEEDVSYIYYHGVFGLSTYQSEEELKEFIPDACNPGEHNWTPHPDLENTWICGCDARREVR